MKKIRDYVKKLLIDSMDLPADVIMDMPRVTMIGNLHVYIENHHGVIRFTHDELRLALKEGQLVIEGQEFIIKMILPEEILLEGVIKRVYYEGYLNSRTEGGYYEE